MSDNGTSRTALQSALWDALDTTPFDPTPRSHMIRTALIGEPWLTAPASSPRVIRKIGPKHLSGDATRTRARVEHILAELLTAWLPDTGERTGDSPSSPVRPVDGPHKAKPYVEGWELDDPREPPTWPGMIELYRTLGYECSCEVRDCDRGAPPSAQCYIPPCGCGCFAHNAIAVEWSGRWPVRTLSTDILNGAA